MLFPGCQILEVCLALSLRQSIPIHMHAHDLHSDTCHSVSHQKKEGGCPAQLLRRVDRRCSCTILA